MYKQTGISAGFFCYRMSLLGYSFDSVLKWHEFAFTAKTDFPLLFLRRLFTAIVFSSIPIHIYSIQQWDEDEKMAFCCHMVSHSTLFTTSFHWKLAEFVSSGLYPSEKTGLERVGVVYSTAARPLSLHTSVHSHCCYALLCSKDNGNLEQPFSTTVRWHAGVLEDGQPRCIWHIVDDVQWMAMRIWNRTIWGCDSLLSMSVPGQLSKNCALWQF